MLGIITFCTFQIKNTYTLFLLVFLLYIICRRISSIQHFRSPSFMFQFVCNSNHSAFQLYWNDLVRCLSCHNYRCYVAHWSNYFIDWTTVLS